MGRKAVPRPSGTYRWNRRAKELKIGAQRQLRQARRGLGPTAGLADFIISVHPMDHSPFVRAREQIGIASVSGTRATLDPGCINPSDCIGLASLASMLMAPHELVRFILFNWCLGVCRVKRAQIHGMFPLAWIWTSQVDDLDVRICRELFRGGTVPFLTLTSGDLTGHGKEAPSRRSPVRNRIKVSAERLLGGGGSS